MNRKILQVLIKILINNEAWLFVDVVNVDVDVDAKGCQVSVQ